LRIEKLIAENVERSGTKGKENSAVGSRYKTTAT
jgi:hypothetical protein